MILYTCVGLVNLQLSLKETPGWLLRRGSAPTALHQLNWLDTQRGKENSNASAFLGRQGSLRLAHCSDKDEPSLRRRGSLPYELGRKFSGHVVGDVKGKMITLPPEQPKLDLSLRRGSAPSDLLRSTSASITSSLVQFRDRMKTKVCTVPCVSHLDKAPRRSFSFDSSRSLRRLSSHQQLA